MQSAVNRENSFILYGHGSIDFVIKIVIATACIFCLYIQPAYAIVTKNTSVPSGNACYIVDLVDILDLNTKVAVTLGN